MDGSFISIVAKIITKLFLALVSVYAPPEEEVLAEPSSIELRVECIIYDSSDGVNETYIYSIDEISDNIIYTGHMVLKNIERSSDQNNVILRLENIEKPPEEKQNMPIRLKKV